MQLSVDTIQSRDDLPALFVAMGFKVGAEIGIYKAGFTCQLLAAGLQVYGIDPWKAYANYQVSRASGKPYSQERCDFLYGHACRATASYPRCTLLRKTSMEAVKDFADGSLDFVYIDGHHGFKYVAEDIWEWSKKVRVGGIISGHDYVTGGQHPLDPCTVHVRYVVDAYAQACSIGKLIILKKDKIPSWMWVKS